MNLGSESPLRGVRATTQQPKALDDRREAESEGSRRRNLDCVTVESPGNGRGSPIVIRGGKSGKRITTYHRTSLCLPGRTGLSHRRRGEKSMKKSAGAIVDHGVGEAIEAPPRKSFKSIADFLQKLGVPEWHVSVLAGSGEG